MRKPINDNWRGLLVVLGMLIILSLIIRHVRKHDVFERVSGSYLSLDGSVLLLNEDMSFTLHVLSKQKVFGRYELQISNVHSFGTLFPATGGMALLTIGDSCITVDLNNLYGNPLNEEQFCKILRSR